MATEQSFLRNVADHEMTIIRDDGVNRHLRFKKPGDRDQQFDIITWPWHLCYCGDMGCYVFERLEDMFCFFRGSGMRINPHYWAEKLQAVDRCDGLKKWNPDEFLRRVKEDFDDWLAGGDLDEEAKKDAQYVFDCDVVEAIDEGKDAAYMAAIYLDIGGERPLQHFFEVDTDEFTYRYLWCCYALVWGVGKYDEHKDGTVRDGTPQPVSAGY